MEIHRTNSRTSLLIYGLDGRVKHRLYLGPSGVIADESTVTKALWKLARRTDFVELILTDLLEGRLPSGIYKSCRFNSGTVLTGTLYDCCLADKTIYVKGSAQFFNCDLSDSCVYADGVDASLRLDDCNMLGSYIDSRVDCPSVIHLGYCDCYRVFAYRTSEGLRIRAGCRDKSLNEAKAYWHEKNLGRREIREAVLMAEKIALLRGWI